MRASWKLYLTFCSQSWVRTSPSLARSFTCTDLCQTNVLLAVDLTNLKTFDLQMLRVFYFRMFVSNSFHLITVEKKYEFFKNWCFTLTSRILCAFLVLYWQLACRILSKRYFGGWLSYMLSKKLGFLYQCLFKRGPKPALIFITFWDFLTFYQIYFSPQAKRCAIISYKHGIYELPNDLRL